MCDLYGLDGDGNVYALIIYQFFYYVNMIIY